MKQTELEKYCRMRNRYGSEFGTCKCEGPADCKYGPPTLAERRRSRVFNMGVHLREQARAMLIGDGLGEET